MSPPENAPGQASPAKVAAALFALYAIWGSTYLVMRLAMVGFPPLQMAGIRFVCAGGFLLVYLLWRGAALPTRRQWRYALALGALFMVLGNGGVAVAEQWVASSLAAVMVASMPLWAALFSGIWGRWPTRLEWLGLLLGTVGVVLLSLEGELRASPWGAFLLIVAPLAWGFGSVWSRRVDLPAGPMASASQMLCGGVLLLLASGLHGDPLPVNPPLSAVLSILYLIFFGSIVAFSAYGFLLRNVRPSLATSYAYVNPVVAVLLGVGLAGESIEPIGVAGTAVIIAAVAMVAVGKPGNHERAQPAQRSRSQLSTQRALRDDRGD